MFFFFFGPSPRRFLSETTKYFLYKRQIIFIKGQELEIEK